MNNSLKLICLAILLTTLVNAQDFNTQVKRIQENGDQIDSQMRTMGFLLQNKNTFPIDEEKKRFNNHLFKVHNDNTLLRSESGKVLHAETTNRLVVGPEGSPAIALIQNDQGLFSGLKVIGIAKQSSTEGRLFIDFDRIIFRSGRALSIKASALDEVGAFGLSAQVLSSKALMIAGSIAGSFISGYATSQQVQQTNAFGFSQTQPGARNSVLQGVAQTAADQSKRLIDDATKEKPILVVEPGTKISLYLDQEVKF